MVYIRSARLQKLHEYKYSSIDHSLVSKYILKPFYNNVAIKCFPMSMAPNAITLSGFGFVVANFLTLLWYNPTLDQDMPSWVYYSWAAGLFLYQTFDAVDGSQARRTKQSGPLGELFDHGVDACNTVFEVVLFAAAMNLGQGWSTFMVLVGAASTFYIQTWDEYWTRTLTFGIVSGPVEGILTLCIVFVITGIKGGGSFWHNPALPYFGISHLDVIPDFLYDMPFYQWFIAYGGAILCFNTISSAQNVLSKGKESEDHTKDGMHPLAGLLPGVYLWVISALYLWFQPVILHYHLVPFIFCVGIANAYSVGMIIIAHLTKNPEFPLTNCLFVPVTLAFVDSLAHHIKLWPSALGDGVYQIAFMFCYLGLVIGVYGSFVYDIITTICDYLDIWCLTIKHPTVEDERSSEASVNGDKKSEQDEIDKAPETQTDSAEQENEIEEFSGVYHSKEVQDQLDKILSEPAWEQVDKINREIGSKFSSGGSAAEQSTTSPAKSKSSRLTATFETGKSGEQGRHQK